jgi:Phage capsid protein
MTTMSNDPNTVLAQYVPGFRANMNLSPQQTTSRLIDAVDADLNYSEPGEGFNLDDVGESDPDDVATRVADTPDKFLGSERRVANFTEFHDSAWLDNVDKAKQLVDPANLTMQALMAGRWRKADSKIIQAGLGVSFKKDAESGGLLPISLPATQIVAANSVKYAHDDETVPGGGADYGIGIGKIIEANALLDESELEGDRFITLSSDDVANLLRQTPVTSRYYSDVQALSSGKVSEILGFKVKRLSKKRIPIIGDKRRLMAWVKTAIAYRGRPVTNARIAVRTDKSDTPQAFYKTSHAAGRRYDEAVVEIQAKI